MKTLLKVIGSLLLLLVIIIVIGAIAIHHYIATPTFQQKIVKSFQQKMGRQVTLTKPAEFSFFPWLGVKLDKISIGDLPGFGKQAFAKIDQAEVKFKLIPLLKGHIEIGHVILHGLEVHLIKNANGVGNWQTPSAPPLKMKAVSHSKNPPLPRRHQPADVKIAKIDLDRAKFTWDDFQHGQHVVLQNIHLQSQNLSPNHPFPVRGGLDIISNKPQVAGHITIKLMVEHGTYAGDIVWKNIEIKSRWQKAPQATKQFVLDLTGQLSTNIQQRNKSIRFDFTSPDINLDHYTAVTAEKIIVAQQSKAIAAKKVKAVKMKAKEIPFKILQQFDLNGRLHVTKMTLKKAQYSDLNIPIRVQDGILNINPISAKLQQGTVKARLQINAHNTPTQISFSSRLQNIEASQLIKFKDKPFGMTHISGLGNVTNDLQTNGDTTHDLIRHLKGDLAIDFRKGRLQGIDIPYELEKIYTVVRREHQPTRSPTNSTPFLNLTINSTIKQGVANNKLHIKTPLIHGEGSGTINLLNQALDFNLVGHITDKKYSNKAMANLAQLPISVKLTGTLKHHQFQPNIDAITQWFLNIHKKKLFAEVRKKSGGDIGDFLSHHF